MLAYYDRIAERWEQITGPKGGALKELVLNDMLLKGLGSLSGCSILELGAGNGYFMRMAFRHLSGGWARRIVITDASAPLLEIAKDRRPVPGAEYQVLDIRGSFPFEDEAFDIIVAVMVFNEMTDAALRKTLQETHRVLRTGGRLLGAVVHPAFVESLHRRGELQKAGVLTMPGAQGVRLPVMRRTIETYAALVNEAGFEVMFEDVKASRAVRLRKPGLTYAGNIPIALQIGGTKRVQAEPSA